MASSEPHQFKAESVGQIGILVKEDPEELSKTWEKMLGIGPWRIHEIKYKDKSSAVSCWGIRKVLIKLRKSCPKSGIFLR